jgi:molecular chaperone GrpE
MDGHDMSVEEKRAAVASSQPAEGQVPSDTGDASGPQETSGDGVELAPQEGEEEAVEAHWQGLIETAESDQQQLDPAVLRLVDEYKEAIKARDEWEDKYLRAAADYANAKRRAELRAAQQIADERGRVLNRVLPVLDDLERALTAVPEEEEQSAWVEGFGLILRKLETMLEREGVSPIEAVGQPFDPNLHQAVMMVAAEDVEPGTVVAELQRGYVLGDRVLRPSMVQVAQ